MNFRKITIPPRVRRIGTAVAAVGAVCAIAFVPSAVAGPANSVSSYEVVNGSLNTIDMDTATNTLYANTKPAANQVDNTSQIAPNTVDETDLNAPLRAKVNAAATPGADGKSYGCDGAVVDAAHPAATCPGTPGAASTVAGPTGATGPAGPAASDAKGKVLVSETFAATTVVNCGGSFKTQKTKLGEFTLPAGSNLSVDSYLFAARTATAGVGVSDTIGQLALRIGATEAAFGEDRGTVLTPLPRFANREATGTAFWMGNNAAPVTVEVFGFCYALDAEGSTAGAGQWTATAKVRVTQG